MEEILELSYLNDNSVILFKCKWYHTRSERKKIQHYNNKTSICVKGLYYKNGPFVLASQVEQVFYVNDLFSGPNWKVVEHFGHRHIWDFPDEVVDKVIQDKEFTNVQLSVKLLEMDSLTFHRSNIDYEVVLSDVDTILKEKSPYEDEFIVH